LKRKKIENPSEISHLIVVQIRLILGEDFEFLFNLKILNTE